MRSKADDPGRTSGRQGESSGSSMSGSGRSSGSSTSGSSPSSERTRAGGERGGSPARGSGAGLARRGFLRGGPLTGSPWDLMRRATEEMERMLDAIDLGSFESGPSGVTRRGAVTEWLPQIEVERQTNSMTVRVDLPGMDPDDISVTTEDGMLIVSGERSQERREEEEGYVRSERRYGHFYRAIPLPEGVDESNIDASFDKGVLEITVPVSGKHEQGRRIPVSSGSSRSQTSRASQSSQSQSQPSQSSQSSESSQRSQQGS